VTELDGFAGSVNLAASGLPAGVTASFGTNPTTSASTLTLTASSSAAFAFPAAEILITGTSGSLTATASVEVGIVLPFNLSGGGDLTVSQGGSTSAPILVILNGGFSGNVALSVTSPLPSGVTASFNPPVSIGGEGVFVTFTASSSATLGTTPVEVTGVSGNVSQQFSYNLTVTPEAADSGATDAGDASSSDAATDGSRSVGCVSGSTIIAETGCASFGNFNIAGAVCVKVKVNTVNGWEASEVQGRTATVNGATNEGPITPVNGSMSNEPGLSAGTDGFVYFNFTAGAFPYSSMACW
jgi:hypothetical protein